MTTLLPPPGLEPEQEASPSKHVDERQSPLVDAGTAFVRVKKLSLAMTAKHAEFDIVATQIYQIREYAPI